MKKFLLMLTSVLSLSVMACWFTESNYNATYISSVNGKVIHYSPVDSMYDTVYTNGQSVDLPITVQVKVSPRFGDTEGESAVEKPIVKAILQYKIVRRNGTSTTFKTVKTIDNPNWQMNFSRPVNLFGNNGKINISANNISAGDIIIIRVYLSDGMFHTGDLNADISADEIQDRYTGGNVSIGNGGWSAPHVFKVVYSGKRRLTI